ncbi:Rhodanese-like domain protein [hydrothermal vent metagenome]|uniref:Rhodanese-like domain protein n=1 Tax=hydrothermal vent metagenome TaxID=652676 RepID=A0A3B1D147_9ZZZZ
MVIPLPFAEAKPEVKNILIDIRQRYSDVPYISVNQLYQWLNNENMSPPLIIDVREKKEYAVSHLPGAIWVGSKNKQVFKFLKNEVEQKIILYCSIGERSAKMVRWLERKGVKNIYNLEGSIFQWANEGLPIFKEQKKVKKVHPFNKHWGQLLKKKYH